jgi:hypothetical protein
LYIVVVALTISDAVEAASGCRYLLAKADMMVSKIRQMDLSVSSANEMVEKCLRRRGVTGFRPPPVGPMLATICTHTMLRNFFLHEHNEITFNTH